MVPMPVMGGVLSVPVPGEGRRLAQAKLESALQQLKDAGATADGEAGDADPICAVEAALTKRQFDEIIVATLPERLSRWLHQDLPRRIEHKFHLPVTHVCARAVPRR
jgi:GABA permease